MVWPNIARRSAEVDPTSSDNLELVSKQSTTLPVEYNGVEELEIRLSIIVKRRLSDGKLFNINELAFHCKLCTNTVYSSGVKIVVEDLTAAQSACQLHASECPHRTPTPPTPIHRYRPGIRGVSS